MFGKERLNKKFGVECFSEVIRKLMYKFTIFSVILLQFKKLVLLFLCRRNVYYLKLGNHSVVTFLSNMSCLMKPLFFETWFS